MGNLRLFATKNNYFQCWFFYLRQLSFTHFVMATAMSYTGSLLSRKRYFPMSVRAEAESIASLPTRFRSR